jgi:hypothetical protein
MTHISDDLPLLLTGDANRETVMAAAAHLRNCDDCRQELVSATVSHASLTSAHRFAPDIVARTLPHLGEVEASEDELPDLSGLFAQVREEAAPPAAVAPRRPRRTLIAVAAAGAGLLIGAGAVVTAQHLGSSQPASHSVALAAYDTGSTPATAKIATNGTLTVDAASLPAPDAAHRYEVWLTDSARTRMVPVGWIGANGVARMTVPHDVLVRYSDIEVSVQDLASPSYDYSGTSVLRGSYAT